MGLKEDVYLVLHENLCAVRPEYQRKEVVLCPICLCEIAREDVLSSGVEHIIPQNIVCEDEVSVKKLGTKNQRCGITVLCRSSRICKSDGTEAKDGCNGLKGRLYDRLFKGLLDDGTHTKEELTHRHGIAILVMAYLGAFQYLGYEYILRAELDEIRLQFDFPEVRKTDWLDHAKYNLSGKPAFVATSSGQPFVFGGSLASGAPLHIFFRRCQAYFPSGHWQLKSAVRHLDSLLPSR